MTANFGLVRCVPTLEASVQHPTLHLSCLLACFAACKPAPPQTAVDPQPNVVIRIVALNDFHGALYERRVRGDQGKAIGGLPWLVSAVEALRLEDPELIVLDGGDQFQGAWPVNASQGMGAIAAMELLGLDAAAVGNHEFDYGALAPRPGALSTIGDPSPPDPGRLGAFARGADQAVTLVEPPQPDLLPLPGEEIGTLDVRRGHPLRSALEAAAASASYPFLAANVYEGNARWLPEGVEPWTVIERRGKRIGVVGLSTTDTPQTTVPAHVQGLTFADPVATVRQLLPELQAADLDATVLVAHLTGSCEPTGYLEPGAPCTPDGEIGRLLTELPEGTFDVMVLGHAHTLLAHRIGETFLLESRASGHALGGVDLAFGPDGLDLEASAVRPVWGLVHEPVDPGCSGEAFPTDPIDVGGRTLAPSAEALALIAELEAASGSLCEQIACADHPLQRDRAGESELGNWLADAMLAAFPEADLAIQNSGGIRSDLPEGPIRREHLQAVMPFDNRTLLVELTGAQVRTLLQIGTSGAHGILAVAGASLAVAPEAHPGDDLDGDGEIADWEQIRLCPGVQVGGQPLDDDARYKIVTSDFLYTGGDHLGPAFAGAPILDEGPLLREVFYAHAEASSECLGASPLILDDKPRIGVGACP